MKKMIFSVLMVMGALVAFAQDKPADDGQMRQKLFDAKMREMVYRLKYNNRPDIGEDMGRVMASELQLSDFFSDIAQPGDARKYVQIPVSQYKSGNDFGDNTTIHCTSCFRIVRMISPFAYYVNRDN